MGSRQGRKGATERTNGKKRRPKAEESSEFQKWTYLERKH